MRTKTIQYEIRHALRSIVGAPAFAAVVVLGLAIGISASTVIFSVVNGILLRPLPYPQPDRLFTITEVVPRVSQLKVKTHFKLDSPDRPRGRASL
jgi:hypothetical protein